MRVKHYRGFSSHLVSMLMHEGFELSLGNLKILRTVEDKAYGESFHYESPQSFLYYTWVNVWTALTVNQALRQSLLPSAVSTMPSAAVGYIVMAVKDNLPAFVTCTKDFENPKSRLKRCLRKMHLRDGSVSYSTLPSLDFIFEHEVEALDLLSRISLYEADTIYGVTSFKVVPVDADTLAQLELYL